MELVTHLLLGKGKDVMRLTFENVQCHSQTVDHKNRNEMKLLTNVQCHSLAVGSKKCDQIAFQKMCNGTHCLLVRGKNMMRLPFTKFAM